MSACELHVVSYIDLPAHFGAGGFDHADILDSLLYVAHTANQTVDVIDIERETYLKSLPDHPEAAGVLVSAERRCVFVSNRSAGTVTVRRADGHEAVGTLPGGVRPNGLAYDARRDLLLIANVGDPVRPETHTVRLVAVAEHRVVSTLRVAGRTRWAIYAPELETFFVNISQPPQIVAISSADPNRIARVIDVPIAGPHGLTYDSARRRLFCACDGGQLVAIDASTDAVAGMVGLAGVPDVVTFNRSTDQLYVAIGDPGCVHVIDAATMHTVQSVPTERGAKTTAFDAAGQRLYAFLPASHRALVLDIRTAVRASR